MALIECTECGKEVSDKAASCPSCGAPISNQQAPVTEPAQATTVHVKTSRTGGMWEGAGFLLIVAGMITAMATGDDNHMGGALVGIGFVLFIIGRFK